MSGFQVELPETGEIDSGEAPIVYVTVLSIAAAPDDNVFSHDKAV